MVHFMTLSATANVRVHHVADVQAQIREGNKRLAEAGFAVPQGKIVLVWSGHYWLC